MNTKPRHLLLRRRRRRRPVLGVLRQREGQQRVLGLAHAPAHGRDGVGPRRRADELREDGQAGLDVRIGDGGVALSNAEAQQLGIARVLLRDYDVVLLDEVISRDGLGVAGDFKTYVF